MDDRKKLVKDLKDMKISRDHYSEVYQALKVDFDEVEENRNDLADEVDKLREESNDEFDAVRAVEVKAERYEAIFDMLIEMRKK